MTEQVTKKLSDYTIEELKSLAYDELVKVDVARNNLELLNREIAKRSQASVEQK